MNRYLFILKITNCYNENSDYAVKSQTLKLGFNHVTLRAVLLTVKTRGSQIKKKNIGQTFAPIAANINENTNFFDSTKDLKADGLQKRH